MAMQVLVIDDLPERASRMVESLREAGYEVLGVEDSSVAVMGQMDRQRPDVVLINAESAQRDIIEHSVNGLRGFTTPVILFDKGIDAESAAQASRVGVSIYAIDDVPSETLNAVIQASVAQFTAHGELKSQIGAAEAQIEEERMIARAKTTLVEQGRMSEAEAHRWMRKTAMDNGRRLSDVARVILKKAGVSV